MDNCWKREGKFWRIVVYRGCMLPDWYGLCYADHVRDAVVCYPIPLNLIFRWAINFYHKLSFPKIVSGDYAHGYHDGFEAARKYFGEEKND